MSALQIDCQTNDLTSAASAITVESSEQETALACRLISVRHVAPTQSSYLAFTQLLEQIRGVLVSLLSYELQTPLCVIQTSVETLCEGDTIPAQAQRSMVQLSLSELERITLLVEDFLLYANEIWALTLDFAQFRPRRTAAAYLKSMFSKLCKSFEKDQRWIKVATARLQPCLSELLADQSSQTELIWSEERNLLEREWRQTLAIVNHELRTPFTTLKVCLETLESDGITPLSARLALLAIAEDDLERLRGLSQDLELLSRLTARQVHFQTEAVDLAATLQSVLSSFSTKSAAASVANVRIENETPSPLVWADGDHLAEVLQRLLENAYRFTETTGDVCIKHQVFGLESSTPGKPSTLKIDISDSGCGIEADHLKCVFECFYQEENYLRRSKGGTGIGLTICQYLVEGMGGRIWAESSGKAQGSCFCLVLPIQQEAKPQRY